MQVIITHEQADFDAIAALLGAYIMHDSAIPILPQRANRNVKDFLHLYHADLPFYPLQDVPKKPIASVILVDTQSLVTLKGLSKKTTVSVFDHHRKRDDLSAQWNFESIERGATTTYFVEQIMERNDHVLSAVEATLLLMGVYEDTGMLTYTNTTARDAAAVAFLLSNNANLEIAAQFLNPPLSPTQQLVFQNLLKTCEHLKIKGLEIFLGMVSAPDLDDEVSSIAHKINDLFDPDALFIFVALKEGIRLVARSSTDRIDTSALTAAFGGGGHKRASAALIAYDDRAKDQLIAIQKSFLGMLPDFILPAVTVGTIMSKKPLTLKPNTTVAEARRLMESYGYEGFPVLDGEKVVGLLNRRAVDKAISHNLSRAASSLMEAGNFFVSAQDSLRHLQNVMAESGWGQIPVLSADQKEMVGIVTRTDLLKALTGENTNNKQLNLSQSIREDVPPGSLRLLELVSHEAAEIGFPIYIVGGFVRDLILRKPSPDFDIVVEGDAIQLAHILAATYGGKVTSHKKFGTAKWWPLKKNSLDVNGELPINRQDQNDIPSTLDLISARTEFYEKPTALPTIKQSSIKLDLHRRDFSINTMAVRLDGSHFGDVYDYWGGLNDLENGLVRVLHSLSFVDDPTRMLRAVRFEKRFNFTIEERTLELLHEAVAILDEVSGDRIRHELDQIFSEENAADMLQRLDELGILAQIHKSLVWNESMSQDLRKFKESRMLYKDQGEYSIETADKLIDGTYLILTCRLATESLRAVIKRLRFRGDFQQILLATNSLWTDQDLLSTLLPGEFSEKIEKYPPLAVCVLSSLSLNAEFSTKSQQFINTWRKMDIVTSGDDLKQMHIPPGPIYHQILRQLRIARINGEIISAESELEMLQRILSKMN